jgi:hypothetical protein
MTRTVDMATIVETETRRDTMNATDPRTIEAAVRMMNEMRAIAGETVLKSLFSDTMIAYVEAALESGQSVDVAARLVRLTN